MRNLPMYVWFDNEEVDVPVFMGTLTASFVRGHEVFSFDFDTDWLKYKQFRNFDPDLQPEWGYRG